MNEKMQSIISLFKKDQITPYVVEREVAQELGDDCSVKIVKDPKNIATKSFCIFALPQKLINGFHITFIVDEGCIKNIYTDEDFAVVVERLKNKKQAIFKRFNKFLKETKNKDTSYNYALGFILDLYNVYRADLTVRDGEYLPDDGEMMKYADLFTMENGNKEDIESLLLGEFVCPEIIEFVKQYVKAGEFKEENEKIFEVEVPTFNLGQQEIKKHVSSTFGIRNHKDIPYDYYPKTNQ